MAGQKRSSLIDVDDAAFQAGLQRALAGMKITSRAGLLRVGLRVQNGARQLCPVDTGRLRSSISAVPGEDALGPYVEVGTNVEYGAYVEFGTSRQAAQPFLRPALAEAVGYAGPTIAGRGGR